MKSIEIDDDLYAFIASQTKHIGESASQILRRLLLPEDGATVNAVKGKSEAQSEELDTAPLSVPEMVEVPHVSAKVAPDDKVQSNAPSKSKAVAPKKVMPASKRAPVAEATVEQAVTKVHAKEDIVDVITSDALSTFTKRVDQFLFVLSAAHKLNEESFSAVESIKGKNRTYFATRKEALLENGSSTNPKAIPDSPYWVVSNNNTAKKVNMLEQVLRVLGYKPEVVDTVISRFSSEGK